MIFKKKLNNKFLYFLLSLILLATIFVGATSINHPIILKWISGSARIIGRPINASVYKNGKINNAAKVFHTNSYWNGKAANYYILYFTDDNNYRKKVLSIHENDGYVGVATSTNVRDYDFVFGFLFQSETGSHFVDMKNDIKGFNIYPRLAFNDKSIKLIIPSVSKKFEGYDSLLVIL